MTHLLVAFATDRHARDAVRFLDGTTLVTCAPSIRGGEGGSFAVVDFRVDPEDCDRLATLLSGLHGIVLREAAPLEAVAVA